MPDHRRRGYAIEAARALMDWAAQEHDVASFFVSIAPDNVASLALAAKLSFAQVGEQIDEEDGLEYVFQLVRPLVLAGIDFASTPAVPELVSACDPDRRHGDAERERYGPVIPAASSPRKRRRSLELRRLHIGEAYRRPYCRLRPGTCSSLGLRPKAPTGSRDRPS